MEALQPSDRVLVIGESSLPQTCVKADEVALRSFFSHLFYIALPDHSDRRVSGRVHLSHGRLC